MSSDDGHGSDHLDEPVENGQVAVGEDVAVEPADMVPVKPPRNKGGAQRKNWVPYATEAIAAEETLRAAARRWLKQKEILVKPFSTSSNKSKACLLARCGECETCTLEYCFSLQSKEELLVERFGECSGKKDQIQI